MLWREGGKDEIAGALRDHGQGSACAKASSYTSDDVWDMLARPWPTIDLHAKCKEGGQASGLACSYSFPRLENRTKLAYSYRVAFSYELIDI